MKFLFPNNRKQESADCKLPPSFSFQSRLNSLSKVTRCFSLGGFAPFFVRLMLTKERSGRQICRPLYSVCSS